VAGAAVSDIQAKIAGKMPVANSQLLRIHLTIARRSFYPDPLRRTAGQGP